MVNRSESKYFHTALLMDEVLIALLEKKDFEYITVKEICNKAGVNRPTFYLHYETISDLLNETIQICNRQFMEQFAFVPNEFVKSIENVPLDELIFINMRYLQPYLTFIRDRKAVFKAAFKNPACMNAREVYKSMYRHVLMPIMSRFHIPLWEQPYRMSFYIHSCMAIIQEWMRQDCEDSLENIARVITECVLPKMPDTLLRDEG